MTLLEPILMALCALATLGWVGGIFSDSVIFGGLKLLSIFPVLIYDYLAFRYFAGYLKSKGILKD